MYYTCLYKNAIESIHLDEIKQKDCDMIYLDDI